MAAQKDYYQILGIDKNASPDEIKRAYRKLALQFHPDRNKSKDADLKFKEVTRAYEVISDPHKKATYDQLGHQAFEQGGGQQGPFGGGSPFGGQQGPFSYTYTTSGGAGGFDFGGSDPFDIFEQFFGGAGGSPFRQRRQAHPAYAVTISFMEAVHGVQKEVVIDGKKQKIKIPAGVDNGTRIRFEKYDIVTQVEPHSSFQREGFNIVTEEHISFPQAVLGTSLDVKTVHENITLRIPSGTQPETVFRLRGKGVKNPRGGEAGDHYVKIKIRISKSVSPRQKELLQEFEEESSKKKNWF
ncbi:MAG: DnaJ C-terminal domain-containing protein [Patescibacteria group bacterium]